MYKLFNRLVPFLQKQDKEEVDEDHEQKKPMWMNNLKMHIQQKKVIQRLRVCVKKVSLKKMITSPHNITKMHYLNACLRNMLSSLPNCKAEAADRCWHFGSTGRKPLNV